MLNYISVYIKNFYGKYIRRFLVSKFFFFNKYTLLKIVKCTVFVNVINFRVGTEERILGALNIFEVITGCRGCVAKSFANVKSKAFVASTSLVSCLVSLHGKQVLLVLDFLNKLFLPFVFKRKLTIVKVINYSLGTFELRIRDITFFYKYCDNIYEEDFEIVFSFKSVLCCKVFRFFGYNAKDMLNFFFPSFFNFKNV